MTKTLRGSTPYYLQIEAILRSQIASGDLRPGEQVSTEKVLCDQYGVSRPTVRQAIRNLEQEGLLVRERGRGTKVIERPENMAPPLVQLSVRALLDGSYATSVNLVRTGHSISPPIVRAVFGFQEPTEVFSFVTVLKKNDTPVAVIKYFLTLEYSNEMQDEDFARADFLQLFERKFNLELSVVDQNLGAILAEPIMADFLDIASGTPLISIHSTARDGVGRDGVGRAYFHRHTLIPTDRCRLELPMSRRAIGENWSVG